MNKFAPLRRTLALVFALAPFTACSRSGGDMETAAGPTGPVVTLTAANFDAEIAQGVVLVDFWATWCPPCRQQGPVVDRLAATVQGKAKVAKLDVDTASKIAERFEITGIPTLIVFKDGKPVQQFVGFTRHDALAAAIAKAAGNSDGREGQADVVSTEPQ